MYFVMNELFWLECELKSTCSGQICRRRKVNYEIDEVTLRPVCYGPIMSDGRTLFDAVRTYIDENMTPLTARNCTCAEHCTI